MRCPLTIAFLLFTAATASAQTFKCKNVDGKVSFQDQPCAGQTTGDRIVVRPTPPSSDPAEIAKAKAVTTRNSGQDLAVSKHNQDVAERNQQVDAHNRTVNCERARHALGTLKQERPVFRYDNKGEKQYIEDSARQAEIGRAQNAVAANCS